MCCIANVRKLKFEKHTLSILSLKNIVYKETLTYDMFQITQSPY